MKSSPFATRHEVPRRKRDKGRNIIPRDRLDVARIILLAETEVACRSMLWQMKSTVTNPKFKTTDLSTGAAVRFKR